MTRQLPSLKGLRAFEAAARHLSFSKAAEELNVTPAAVGHQIRALESYFGRSLFERSTREVKPTAVAVWALPVLTQGFDCLEEAAARLRDSNSAGLLNLAVESTFAAKWLLGRLHRFGDNHPAWEVRLNASQSLADLNRFDVDMAIRYGAGRYPGMVAEKLFGEEVFPVCSPRLLKGEHPLRTPADLRWHTLLHEDRFVQGEEAWPDWRAWLKAAGVVGVDPARGPRFNDSSLTIQAAINGDGVMLAGSVLVSNDLAAGRLVRPFGPGVTTQADLAYYVVYPEGAEQQPKVKAFRDWLFSECAPRA
jgi:LysR family glycine cleavage system transcriptional activator